MNGSIRRRSKDSWELTIDLGKGASGKRLRKFVAVKGTKVLAQQKLREILASLDKGLPLDNSKATVGDFLARWMRDYVATNTAPSTEDGYGFIVRCHLIPGLGHIPLHKLQPTHLQAYYAKALVEGRRDGKGGLSPRTVQHHHRVLAEALNHAVKWGLVARNVAKAVDPPRPVRQDIVHVTPVDIQRLLATAQGTPLHDLIFTALYTGMRRGELLGMRWCDVDVDLAGISVVQTLQRRYGGEYIFKEPKTTKSRRLISLPPSLAILLRERKEQVIAQRSAIGLPFDESDLVFCQYNRSPLDPSTVSHTFSRIARNAGLPQMRFHDTRHAHASLMLRNGVHPKIVSERLGHSTIAVTIDLYSHVTPGLQEAAALRFEDALQGNALEAQSEPESVPV